MSKVKYEKEDLIWEAVRRKEFYKTCFAMEFDKDKSKNEFLRKRILCGICRVNFPLDPSTKIDDIKKKIASGANPADVHPFYGYLEKWQKPAIHHVIPEFAYAGWHRLKDHESEKIQDRFDEYLQWSNELFRNIEDRIIISIDPLASDMAIADEIKKIKSEALKNAKAVSKAKIMNKQNVDDSDEDDDIFPEKTYMPRGIGNYIGWLEKYDQILEKAKESKGEKNLISDGLVVRVPKDFSFNEMVSNDAGEKYESEKRAYTDAYKNSVEMITNAPWLLFSEARIK